MDKSIGEISKQVTIWINLNISVDLKVHTKLHQHHLTSRKPIFKMAVIAAIFIACRNVMNIANLNLLTIPKDHTNFEVNLPYIWKQSQAHERMNKQTDSNAWGLLQLQCYKWAYKRRYHKNIGHTKQKVAQWATIAHHGASIMFGFTIIYDAQRQMTLTLKQWQGHKYYAGSCYLQVLKISE